MQKRRKGVILVLAAVFLLVLVGLTGFVVDVTRVQLARIQLHTIVDSVGLAAAAGLERQTFSLSNQMYWLTSSSGNGAGCIAQYGSWYYWNSSFPPSGGWPGGNEIAVWTDPPGLQHSCATVHDLVDVFTRLFSPSTLENLQFANFSERFNPYQFRKMDIQIVDIQDASTGSGIAHLVLEGTATVDLLFGHLFGRSSVDIAVQTSTTVNWY